MGAVQATGLKIRFGDGPWMEISDLKMNIIRNNAMEGKTMKKLTKMTKIELIETHDLIVEQLQDEKIKNSGLQGQIAGLNMTVKSKIRTIADREEATKAERNKKNIAITSLMAVRVTAEKLDDQAKDALRGAQEYGPGGQIIGSKPGAEPDYKALFFELTGTIKTSATITDHLANGVDVRVRSYV